MSTALTRASFDRLKSKLESYKEEAKFATRIGVTSMAVVAGGAAAGAISAKLPYVPGTKVPTGAAVGAGLVLLAMSGKLDEQSDHVAAFGAGMLAAISARETEKLLAAA